MSDTGKIIALAKAVGARPDPDDVKQDVEDWLDDHPEATTTVQDGAITKAKLDSSLKETVDDVDALKSAINAIENVGFIDYETFSNTGTSANFWGTALKNVPSSFSDKLYIKITDASGASVSTNYVRVFVYYSDSTNENFYITKSNEWTEFTVNTAKTVSSIMPYFARASATTESTTTTYTLLSCEGKPLQKIIDEVYTELDARVDGIDSIIYDANNGLLVARTPTIEAKEEGKYINHDGAVKTYANYTAYSKPIQVYKGEIVTATLYANSSMAAIAYSDSTGSVFTEAIAGDAYAVKEYTITSDRDGYIVLSYVMAETHTVSITTRQIYALKERASVLETDMQNVAPSSNITVTTHSTGYITGNGTIVANDALAYSEIIPVNKGDVITATLMANTAMSAISYVTPGYTFIRSAVMGRSYNIEEYTLTSEHTGYIALCYYKDYQHTCTIKQNKVNELELANPLKNKFVVWCGDSIMRGNTWNDANDGWAGRVADLTGCRFVNYGIGGSTITNNVTGGATPTIYTQIETAKTAYPDADYIIFDGGCNDADLIGNATGSTKPAAFGSFDENDFSGEYDTNTFCGAFESICMHLSQYWLGKHVGYIIPHKMGVSNNYHAGTNNYRTYYETAIQICNKWGIKVLNLWDECYLNPKHNWMCDTDDTMTTEEKYDAGFLYADRQHLTSAGYDYESTIVADWVKGL